MKEKRRRRGSGVRRSAKSGGIKLRCARGAARACVLRAQNTVRRARQVTAAKN